LIQAGRSGGSVAWIAVENPGHPWPKLPGKDASAGPFYLIWQYPERSQVANEQWPYMLEKLTAVQSPELRWPQLAVNGPLSADAPARLGEAVFATQCLPCHRLNGGGASEIGPDLGQPMAATDYMTEPGLRALVRDPKSVRTWPQQRMPAFPPTLVPDTDLNSLIAYLKHSGVDERVSNGSRSPAYGLRTISRFKRFPDCLGPPGAALRLRALIGHHACRRSPSRVQERD